MTALRERFQGAMAGIAVGDALGFPVEGMETVPGGYPDDAFRRLEKFDYSDDTALSIALAESLLACDGFDGSDMARRFSEVWAREPHRGYGANVVKVFRSVGEGVDWKEAAESQFGGSGSFGNGGAMRVVPVALWAYPDLEETVRLATATASVTHAHPVGMEGAVIQAIAAHHVLGDGFEPGRLLEDLDQRIETDRFRVKLETVELCLERGDDQQARQHLGNSVAADGSVLTALYCFSIAADFDDTVRRAIRIGGDTDTIAAMAGALAGARYGLSAIPPDWRQVEGFDRMVELGDALYQRVDR
ncbi:MAG TPA: ADP-ribosylglycohydrolase family protein [Acidimicrobiia bacterium]|nr:ADP-ribosylglycohydrolase family protein [Acidimicrobiia bacterium]